MTIIGEPLARIEGREKVTGAARYAFEHTPDGALYAWPVQSSIVRGSVRFIDTDAALALPGVVEVITADNALHLEEVEDGELLVLQSKQVAYRGQVVALVVAETIDTAREGAALLHVEYDEAAGDVELTDRHPKLYAPEKVNPAFPTDTSAGDVEAAIAAAPIVIDEIYSTPALFNNPMEPHASVATWTGDRVDVQDSTQGTSFPKQLLATLFGIEQSSVRVRAEHVGGGFGSKSTPRPGVVLAVMAAKMLQRPVKLSYTRQMMFAMGGYRTPTLSHFRLAAERDGTLTAISHQAFSQTSTVAEFAEQTAEVSRHLYAAPNRLMTHRVAALDVPTPRFMRAPGECPGMYAHESAMDELALAVGIDPVELRVLNDAQLDPETGQPFTSRHLVECLRRGADLFGWSSRNTEPGARRDGRFLVGHGVAASARVESTMPSGARLAALPGGHFRLGVNATDIGTGARTVMRQIAAAELGVDPELIEIHIGDSALPIAYPAAGSAGTSSWGWAVSKACRELLDQLAGGSPITPDGLEVEVSTEQDVAERDDAPRSAFGAQFVEVMVDLDSGEIRVPRMTGVFAAGHIMNARLARSQFIGGMTMGLSMALHENGELDPVLGDYANHDLASYHVAANLDVPAIEVEWIDEQDDNLWPMGGKGIGEIGIVGTAAAVANAVYNATGVRVRHTPIQPDALLAALPPRF